MSKNKLECKFKIGEKAKLEFDENDSYGLQNHEQFGEIIRITFTKDFIFYMVKFEPKSASYATTYKYLNENVLKGDKE